MPIDWLKVVFGDKAARRRREGDAADDGAHETPSFADDRANEPTRDHGFASPSPLSADPVVPDTQPANGAADPSDDWLSGLEQSAPEVAPAAKTAPDEPAMAAPTEPADAFTPAAEPEPADAAELAGETEPAHVAEAAETTEPADAAEPDDSALARAVEAATAAAENADAPAAELLSDPVADTPLAQAVSAAADAVAKDPLPVDEPNAEVTTQFEAEPEPEPEAEAEDEPVADVTPAETADADDVSPVDTPATGSASFAETADALHAKVGEDVLFVMRNTVCMGRLADVVLSDEGHLALTFDWAAENILYAQANPRPGRRVFEGDEASLRFADDAVQSPGQEWEVYFGGAYKERLDRALADQPLERRTPNWRQTVFSAIREDVFPGA